MDETRPLLVDDADRHAASINQSLVDFDLNDPENPLNWSDSYKQGVVFLLAIMAFTVSFTCISVVPVAERIVLSLEGKENEWASILLVTVWELGEAAGPLLIAPLSEIYGRYPVFNAANLIFILGVALSAVSQSANLFIFARFLTGFAVASNVLNPAIIGDFLPSESRGSSMSMIMLAPLLGGAIGPAISGAIAETVGWRAILWICTAVAIVCELLFFLLLRETYKVSILLSKAARLRNETNDQSLKCAWETEGTGASSWSVLRTSILRPILVMWDSLVLKILALYGGLVFAFFYILATTLPGVLSEVYGFRPSLVGSAFLAFSAGATVGIFICNSLLDRLYISLGKSSGGISQPEYRLPLMIVGAFTFPILVALYGLIPSVRGPVFLLLAIVAILGLLTCIIMVPLSSYVVDAFGLYSASAMTVVLVARCLGGTLLPLTIPPLTNALGRGLGFLVLAAVCLVILPLPAIIMRYGMRWRQASIYTKKLSEETT